VGEEVQGLREELEAAKKALAATEKELEATIERSEKDKAKLKEKVKELTANLEALEQELVVAANTIKELERVVKKTEKEKVEALETVDVLNVEVSTFKKSLQRAEADVKEQKVTIDRQSGELVELNSLNSKLQGDMAKLARENEATKRELRESQSTLAGAQRTIEELKRQIERVKREAEQKYAQLIAQVEEITGEKVVVDDKLSVERTASYSLKAEVDRLLARIQALEGVEEECIRRGQQIDSLEGALVEANKLIEELYAELDSIKTEASKRYADLSAEIERITGVKMVVEGDLRGERDVTGNLRDEIERLLRTIEELKRLAGGSQAQQARIRELELEVARLQKTVRRFETETGTFTSEWEDALSPEHHAVSPRSPRGGLVNMVL